MPPDPSVVLVDGPWRHRDVTANGTRFHVAEAGPAAPARGTPLVVLLHGFPEFWWSWRHQLTGLAARGLRVVAPDLRGYGASDKPPRGYDVPNLAADVAGLVRALGEPDCVLVGHDWGGLLAWSVAALHPSVVQRLVVVSMPHPLRQRQAMLAHPLGQGRASSYMLGFQVPGLAETALTRDDAERVGALLHAWGGPGFPDEETERRCREAMQVPGAAHSALEYYRWAVRSLARPSGWRYQQRLARPVAAPTLHLHGALDRCLLSSTVAGSGRYVAGGYEPVLLAGVGHFPHQEAPDTVTDAIARWALPAAVAPARAG